MRLQPALADAHAGLGAALKEAGHKAEAEAALATVVRLRPRCPLALGSLAGAYYEAGKAQAAIATFKQALALQPNFPEVRARLLSACGRGSGVAELLQVRRE